MKKFVNDRELTYEIILSQGKGTPTKKLLTLFNQLIKNIMVKKSRVYDEDMMKDIYQDIFLNLLKNYKNFDSKKYESGLNYITELIKRSMTMSYDILNGTYSKSQKYKDIKFISMTNIYLT